MELSDLDRAFTIYPRATDDGSWVVVIELGGGMNVTEETALDMIRGFDKILPFAFGPMLTAATDAIREQDLFGGDGT